MSADDLDDAMRVMDAAFSPIFGEAWTRAQAQGILDLPGVWLAVRRIDGRPAGFSLARIVLDEAELLLLAVDPDFQRRGIATALLAEVADEARRRGATHLHLEVRAGNDAALLYTRAGFVEVGRRHGYYRGKQGQSFDALSLSCSLLH